MFKSSATTTLLMHPSAALQDNNKSGSNKRGNNGVAVFDSHSLRHQENLPNQFIWPKGQQQRHHHGHHYRKQQEARNPSRLEELNEPLVDLEGFFKGDEEAIAVSAELIRRACLSHGFFQVINHGVDMDVIQAVYKHMDGFFSLPVNEKVRIQRKPGVIWGYSGAHADRFSSKLPWKETFSFGYQYGTAFGDQSGSVLVDYSKSVFRDDFEKTRSVYQKFCQAMEELSLAIFELLAASLGVERLHYKKFYEDGNSLVRCNYYPPCKEPGLTFGTGPHCDPNSLTVLHQDQVGGLEVFANNKWLAVKPRLDALVVNVGDTFTALSNGIYKSCLHRAVVNKERERRSLVFFVSPREDKVVRPPKELVERDGGRRRFPDFKWLDMLEFTQRHYRADITTLQSFFQWIPSSNKNPPN